MTKGVTPIDDNIYIEVNNNVNTTIPDLERIKKLCLTSHYKSSKTNYRSTTSHKRVILTDQTWTSQPTNGSTPKPRNGTLATSGAKSAISHQTQRNIAVESIISLNCLEISRL